MEMETCSEEVGSTWHSEPCGRKVKEDGLCGIHLAAKRRRAEKMEKETARAMASHAGLDSARVAVGALDALGITAYPEYDSGAGYTGGVTIKPESIDRLMELLS